ncbi:ABC transporter permease subunit [Prevotella denticola]|uniref:ABC transporter permease subunit n=1 Tax=Prevotella denticola TaxID=28129 RepID=UPI001C60352F|nr:ABC transporter permease subunit [Prevotella denticola]MBW4713287.1 ABC transporter permease subunit [Prevotella denticola]MBW4751110.1 ABC transporter permease subunit [Prevotella denticola]
MGKITKIIFMDNVKSRVVVFYFVLLALLSWTSLLLQDNESKGALTILNIILFVTPLMSLLYTVTYLYDAHDFLVLLLSQPVERRRIWQSLYTGVSSSLLIAFLLGAGIPMLLYTDWGTGLVLLLMGCVTTQIFVSLAFLATMLASDKTRGTGISILIWLLFTMIYDAVLLYVLFLLSDWPVETPLLALLMLNPLDLTRFQVILKMDVSAMMGYGGAAFKEFLGAAGGIVVSSLLLLLWIIVPYFLSLRIFRKKDL